MHGLLNSGQAAGAVMLVAQTAAALMAIYNSTGGPAGRWAHEEGWGGPGNPCDWYGVCCGEFATEAAGCRGDRKQPEAITGLLLGGNRLTGTLPDSPVVWAAFTRIQTLVFRRNELSGTLPAALGLLTETVDMNLRENLFGGTLPVQLGQGL